MCRDRKKVKKPAVSGGSAENEHVYSSKNDRAVKNKGKIKYTAKSTTSNKQTIGSELLVNSFNRRVTRTM